MRPSFVGVLSVTAALSLIVASSARAENDPSTIDWQTRTIKCTGKAAPNPDAVTVAAARIGAERAAKMDAMRNILETLQGVRINGSKTVADALEDPGIKSQVLGEIRHFKVTATRYFSDGGVEVDVQMPLDGLVGELIPGVNAPAGPKAADAGGATGIVVLAKGLKLKPALAPRILDQAGAVLYGPDSVDRSKAKNGFAAYVKSTKAARKDPRLGSAPVTIKALALAQGSPSDVIISNADAAKVRSANLSGGNVVFVE